MFKDKNNYIIIEPDEYLVNISDSLNELESVRIKKRNVEDINLYGNEVIIITSTKTKGKTIEEEFILSFINEDYAKEAKEELEELLDWI